MSSTATPVGVVTYAGRDYLPDAKGNLVPVEAVKPATRLEDETVRKVMTYAADLSAQLGRFMGHTMGDLNDLDALLAQEYGARGGKKGNRTYMTFDGLMKVQVQVADRIDFGPELQAANCVIDEARWSGCRRDATKSARSCCVPSTSRRKARSTRRSCSCCSGSILPMPAGSAPCRPSATPSASSGQSST